MGGSEISKDHAEMYACFYSNMMHWFQSFVVIIVQSGFVLCVRSSK